MQSERGWKVVTITFPEVGIILDAVSLRLSIILKPVKLSAGSRQSSSCPSQGKRDKGSYGP